MAMIKCPECGQEISDTSRRCVHCNAKLKGKKFNKKKIVISIIILVVVFIGVLVGTVFFKISNASRNLEKGNYDAVISSLGLEKNVIPTAKELYTTATIEKDAVACIEWEMKYAEKVNSVRYNPIEDVYMLNIDYSSTYSTIEMYAIYEDKTLVGVCNKDFVAERDKYYDKDKPLDGYAAAETISNYWDNENTIELNMKRMLKYQKNYEE